MIESQGPQLHKDAEVSMLELGSLLLRRRRLVALLALLGGVAGLAVALATPTTYSTRAMFIPHESQGSVSELALAANQLGIRVPSSTGGGWVPAVYVELLTSRALLEPIVLDTVAVAEDNGRRAVLADLLGVREQDPNRRAELAVQALRDRIDVQETRFGAVSLAVSAPWPSVSYGVVERLLQSISEFNLNKRKSQAMAERLFIESRLAEVEVALRTAEERLKTFMEGNRAYERSPDLLFEHDRLERDVLLRQEVQVSWLKSLEEARIREVRDTPVVTVLEEARLPGLPESRRLALKLAVGMLIGGLLASAIAFLSHMWSDPRRAGSADAQEFLQLIEEASPRFLVRRK